jgi:DDE superfamily endonuclease
VTNTNESAEDRSLVYQVRLPLSRKTIEYCADLLRAHMAKIGTRWRKLPAARIALLVLAVLRHDQRAADLAGANAVSASTINRWRDELLKLLAARAPRLERALRKICATGGEVVLLDGTLIRTRRRCGKANRRNYSGKHKSHGLLFLALTDETGNLIWISSARRGAASEIKTAHHDKICAHLRHAGLGALADLGFVGLDDNPDDPVIVTGYKRTKKRKLTEGQKQANQLIAATRATNEHGFAALKTWRILTRLRLDPARATTLLRALLVLANLETAR